MTHYVERQHEVFEDIFSKSPIEKWAFHDTKDSLIRYLRDRRVKIGVDDFLKNINEKPGSLSALVVCGGVGGEGSLLLNLGFKSVTVSDFSQSALSICSKRDPRLETLALNAEDISVHDDAYDLVLVQDGLHHLSRPTLGFTEMLRVAKVGVIVIEPHMGIIAKFFGEEWERQDNAVNYVFRWNNSILTQVANSYLCKGGIKYLRAIRIWDHNPTLYRLSKLIYPYKLKLWITQMIYFFLNFIFRGLGNMMIGVVIKNEQR